MKIINNRVYKKDERRGKNMKEVEAESLGAVHTHTHTHTTFRKQKNNDKKRDKH